MGGIPAGQVILVDDVARDDVGQRDLGGGDQPPAIRGLVAVLAEFRQLAGAVHAPLRAHEDGAVDLGQAVFLGMGVEHELRQRPVQARDGARHQHEAGARELSRRSRNPCRAMPVSSKCSFGWKSNSRGRAPAVDLDIVVLVRAVGDVVIGQVRDAGEQVAQRLVLFLGLVLQRGDLVLLFGHQRAEAFEFRLVALRPWRPTSLDAALRSASAASAAWMQARRASSRARISDDMGASPRRARAVSKASGASRMARMSCMAARRR
jgi:hypothetical protein